MTVGVVVEEKWEEILGTMAEFNDDLLFVIKGQFSKVNEENVVADLSSIRCSMGH